MAYAAAYVRGEALRAQAAGVGAVSLSTVLLRTPLDALNELQLVAILDAGLAAGLKLYHFKRSHGELPRIRQTLGFLHAIAPNTLLDVGSGRGAFLWPCMEALPHTAFTSADVLPSRVRFLDSARLGGLDRLQAVNADICTFDGGGKRYDVVTLLEVLEHIPDVATAVQNAVRLARRYVVVSVPAQADDNPEHIHLLTREKLTAMFAAAGVTRLRFGSVKGHLLVTAAMEAQ